MKKPEKLELNFSEVMVVKLADIQQTRGVAAIPAVFAACAHTACQQPSVYLVCMDTDESALRDRVYPDPDADELAHELRAAFGFNMEFALCEKHLEQMRKNRMI